MGSFANSLFTLLLGWIQSTASSLWNALTRGGEGSLLQWIGEHWIWLAVILCTAGLLADLAVYLFRWEPYKVWQSFFHRLRIKKEIEETTEHNGMREPAPAPLSGGAPTPVRKTAEKPKRYDPREDLARWTEEQPIPSGQKTQREQEVQITPAGYVVPADSPYRPPENSRRTEAEDAFIGDEEKKENRGESVQQKAEQIVRAGRRRRRITDLLTEESDSATAPEMPRNPISAKDAYMRPVYPRQWQQNEEDDEE